MVILRYAHAFAGGGGGVEQHLDCLDRSLLQRNPWTIIRILLDTGTEVREEVTSVGRGRLVRVLVPVPGRSVPELLRETDTHQRGWVTTAVRDHLICGPIAWTVFGKRYVLRRPIPRRASEPEGIRETVSKLIQRYGVTLLMLHFQGGADAEDALYAAREAGVPVGIENHFANDRFRHLSMRKHALLADAVAGVSGIGVPSFLKDRFTNLSNGIDTDFFRAGAAQNALTDGPPVLLLPARIVRSKGHLDLIAAASVLAKRGFDFAVRFVGREEPGEFLTQLREKIREQGLEHRVKFCGSMTPSGLRDAYASAAVVPLPTYHHEGLPRVLVEAQSMGVPVIAYDNGGVAEAMVPEISGFLLRPGDIEGLASRLAALLSDPAKRRAMGAAGRKFVEVQFSLKAVAERHEDFYRRITAARRSKAGSSPVLR